VGALVAFTTGTWAQSHDTRYPVIARLCKTAEEILNTYPDSAFLVVQQAMDLSEKANFALGLANCHHILGQVYYHQGFYMEALNNLLDAERIYDKGDYKKENAENLNQLGLVYYNIRQPDLALKKHEQALTLYEQLKNPQGVAYTYGCIGHSYEKKQQYPKALEYQQKALGYYQQVNDLRGTATILENIGSIYEDLENYAGARNYFLKALRLNEQTRDSLSMIINLNNLGDSYRKTQQHEQAIRHSGQALDLATRLNDQYQVVSAYKDLSKAYNQAGRYQEAYDNLEKGRNLYEEMYGTETQRQLALLQTLFELERKNNDIKVLEASEQLSSAIKIALVAGIVLLVLLAFAIISRQRLKISQDRQLIDRKESQQQLMQVELENAHLHEKQLQDELENKAKSLTAHTLHVISKNKMLEDLRDKLSEVSSEDVRDYRKKITGLIRLIDHNFLQDRDWDDFRNIFQQVHQTFFDQLQTVSPELTPADTRLAALIRLNLPSKDIATILGISQDSLRIARYRLRKKLGLTRGDSLSRFVTTL
jgi:tetratricopeptide (TPR) repeat protein/DNA-binding CsgD family transcriptional regulator